MKAERLLPAELECRSGLVPWCISPSKRKGQGKQQTFFIFLNGEASDRFT